MNKPAILSSAFAIGALLASLVATPAAFADGGNPQVASMNKGDLNVSYSRTVTFTGSNLSQVTGLYLGTTPLSNLTVTNDTTVSAVVGTAPNFQSATYELYAVNSGSTTKVDTGFAIHYAVTTAQDKEMQYEGANIDKKGTSTYPYYTNEDCANFASQVIHARGLSTDSSWSSGSTDWVSSTHLRSYLLGRGVVTEYSDSQANRAKVKVGDIVQFDWDRSGDRDHTGIVTQITTSSTGFIEIYYSAHTDETASGVQNSPSHNITVEQSEANHEQALKLSSLGKAYFLVF